MVMDPAPVLHELLSIFDRCEPYYDDWEAYWPFTGVSFSSATGPYTVEFEVEPGYDHVHIRLRHGTSILLDLDLRGVSTVETEETRDGALVTVHFPRDSAAETLALRLKPDVRVFWRFGRHGEAPIP